MSNHGVPSLQDRTAGAVSDAIATTRPSMAGADPVVRRSGRADFQSNAALALSVPAAELAEAIQDKAIASVVQSGPGFLNITITDDALWRQIDTRLSDDRLGVGAPEQGRRTVVDYSAPNIAKEMHVGHLRTTIIGDSLVRVLGFLGAEVIRQNHLGDWGTQFGMLIQYLDEHRDVEWTSVLDELYQAARRRFDADEEFADRARARVVALQAGDPATTASWRKIVAESERAFGKIYTRLGVLLTSEDSAGESTYNPMLAGTIAELEAAGLAEESDGALVVFSTEVTGPEGTPVPLMVRKSDGGYGYDTTDLATIRYRVRDLKATRLLYVTDSRQAQHFRLIFEAARRAGWLTDGVEARHVPFGTVLGADGRPFRTRDGGTVRLMSLLDDAVAHAREVVEEKNPDLPPSDLARIAEVAGIGAVKYADLSTSRTRDYTFDTGRMVSLTGNTGVYLQYAHARVRSILRKAADAPEVDPSLPLAPAERALVLALDAYGSTLVEVGETLEPHRLCGYLYDLARAFTSFYDTCPVLTAPLPARGNRLALCALTASTLAHGLDLLGITAPDRM